MNYRFHHVEARMKWTGYVQKVSENGKIFFLVYSSRREEKEWQTKKVLICGDGQTLEHIYKILQPVEKGWRKPLTNMTWPNQMFAEFWESVPGTIKYYLNQDISNIKNNNSQFPSSTSLVSESVRINTRYWGYIIKLSNNNTFDPHIIHRRSTSFEFRRLIDKQVYIKHQYERQWKVFG